MYMGRIDVCMVSMLLGGVVADCNVAVGMKQGWKWGSR